MKEKHSETLTLTYKVLIYKTLKNLNWKLIFQTIGIILLALLSLGIVLSIVIGIPILILSLVFAILKSGYIFLSNLETKYYYALALILFALFFILFYRRIGLITLSLQSISHRRNLLFSLFLVILIEVYQLDISRLFNTEGNKNIEEATMGILCFFALYSFVEYFHNFTLDYIKAKNDSTILPENTFFRGFKLIDIWLFLLGNYRFLFDIILPLAACSFIVLSYQQDMVKFVKVSYSFSEERLVNSLHKHPNQKEQLEHLKQQSADVTGQLKDVYNEIEDGLENLHNKAINSWEESQNK